jgi:hypothetical protein
MLGYFIVQYLAIDLTLPGTGTLVSLYKDYNFAFPSMIFPLIFFGSSSWIFVYVTFASRCYALYEQILPSNTRAAIIIIDQ